MIFTKRGIIYFIFILVLLVNASAEPTTFEILQWDGGSCDDPDECSQALSCCSGSSYTFSEFKGAGKCDAKDGKELPEKFPYSNVGGSKGCYIEIIEDDGWEANDCGWVAIKPGKRMGYNSLRAINILKDKVGAGWDDYDVQEFIEDDTEQDGKGTGKLLYSEHNEYFCGDDEKWITCNSYILGQSFDVTKPDSSDPKEKIRYYCLQNNKDNTYLWMKAEEVEAGGIVDKDSDGVPAGKPGVFDGYLDCDDNNDKIYGKFDCKPKVDDKGKLVKGQEECSISNPEISGNDIDENCDGKKTVDADDDKDSCEKATLNAAGVSYFWMPDAQKGSQCCGDDVDDFGKIFQTEAGERLCLNKNPKSVGSVGKVEEIAGKTSCNGDWCAPLASTQNVHFHIFTIKQPGQSAYDVVSNGDIWQECKEGKEGPLLKPPITTEPAAVNGFYCYKEGDHWSWVNCKPQAENEKIEDAVDNGIKNRVESDGLCKSNNF